MTTRTDSADLFEDAPVGLARVGPDGSWLQVNRHLCELLGYSEEKLRKMRFHDVTFPDDLAADVAQVERLLSQRSGSYSMSKRYIRSDGGIVHANLNVRYVQGANGNGHFISSVQDITKLQRRTAQLERYVRLDPLTRLRNRVGFYENLRDAYRAFKRQGRAFGLAYLDLDGFKSINDSFGHLAGDTLLKAVAHRLVSAAGPNSSCARLGGDEFVVIFNDATSPADTCAALQRLHAIFATPFEAAGQQVSITASIGFAHCPNDASALRKLLEFADANMFETKRATFRSNQNV